ncbi:MAG: DNA methyltransferase [Nocardioides sp.]
MERVLDMYTADLANERPPSASENVHFTRAFVRVVLEEFSSPGDVVFDPFAGYGTTLLVGKELGRQPLGIELLPERASSIRARLGPVGRVIDGDARMLDRFGLGAVDVCLTSPPYMTRFDHPQNPLTAYTTSDGDYQTYLAELLDVFLAVKRHLRPHGYLVINAATIRSGDFVTSLAWDIVHMLRPHLAFQGETYLRWDQPPAFICGDYCLVFRNHLGDLLKTH